MNLKDVFFNHIKIHTQYSICEGAVKIADLADYLKKNPVNAIGISDSLNLSGALEFSELVSKAGVHPIIGTQINLNFQEIIGKISLIAKSETGYKNLINLSSNSYLKVNKDQVPQINLKELLSNAQDLIILFGGKNTLASELILNNQEKLFTNLISEFKNNFKDNLYFEIQRHGEIGEKTIENFLIEKSSINKIPLIATHEVFYLSKETYEAHDAYICVGQKTYVDEKSRLTYSEEHYFKSNDEMVEIFKDLPDALENNHYLKYFCTYRPLISKPLLPSYSINSETKESLDEYLFDLSKSGLSLKLNDKIFKNITDEKLKEELNLKYQSRLDYELKMISKMKFAGYFLIVADYIAWAKNNNIPVGPGRGSGAGSLVAYALSITELDPIKFGLIFERFLNPDRISIPDFDVDFCQEDRDQVINYVKEKYKGKVAQIITFGKLQARMALRDIGRVIGLPYSVVDGLSKMIPFDPSRPLSLQEAISIEPRIQEAQKQDPRIKKLCDLSLKLEGLYRNIATHAAGIIIADKNINEIIPLYKDFESELDIPVTQFDMHWSEAAGLVKFDFLGLKTLTIIKKTLYELNKNGIKLDISSIPLDDKKTFDLLSTGETTGIFQLESSGMQEVLRQMKPDKFEDIIALVALYRPGPMQNISKYNNCKNGIEQPNYIHPKLEPILKETYGVIIYQEQVMQIAQVLSSFSASKADILRKAMGKKKSAEMERQKKDFIEGAVANGIPKEQSIFIFQLVEKFAQYGFNKSHAAAYGLVAYQTAYLKTHYPLFFFSASMNMELSNTDKLNEFYEELKRLDIKVVPPSINDSFAGFEVKENKIYYALSAIKAVGYDSINEIVKIRDKLGTFKNLEDFVLKINSKYINKLQLEGLIKSGAFDCFNKNRKLLHDNVPEIIKISKNFKDSNSEQNNLFGESQKVFLDFLKTDNYSIWEDNEKMKNEFDSIGFFMSKHPLSDYESILKSYNAVPYSKINELDNGKEIIIGGTLMLLQEKKTSKGQPFAILKLSDLSRMYEIFVFSELLLASREKLMLGNSFLINIVKEKLTNGTQRLTVRKITDLNALKEAKINSIEFFLNSLKEIEIVNSILKKNGRTKVVFKLKANEKLLNLDVKDYKFVDMNLINKFKEINLNYKIN